MLGLKTRAYYTVKPLIPQAATIGLRQWLAKRRLAKHSDVWPVDQLAGATPPNWPGWPGGKKFALVLTHDVEGSRGIERVRPLLELEQRCGVRSSFNFVPEDVPIPADVRKAVEQAGGEVGVHGLKHDGRLFFSKAGFGEKAARIRRYLREWNAVGFRAPFMHHDLAWMHELEVEYDASTFDTDPFEPEPDGVRTIFPFWVPGNGEPGRKGYVELPYTLVQDFTLFRVLQEDNIDIWKRKLDWIVEHGGMALLNTHPDYMRFEGGTCSATEYPAARYEEFLRYALERYGDQCWHALPRDVARYYRESLPEAGQRNSRRRIAMVTHSDYEKDNRVRRYAEALAGRGDLVDVLAIETGDAPLGEKMVNGVRLLTVQHRVRNEKSHWTYAYRLLRFLVVSSLALTKLHRKIRYDAVHVHNIPDFMVFSAWYPKLCGAKVVLDIHDIVPELFSNKFQSRANRMYVALLKKIERWSAKFSDHVIIANHLWFDRIAERSATPEKCTVFINHVDKGLFYRRERERPAGASPKIVLFHGTFQWHQGLEIAIEAMALLRDRVPDAELHLYGGGGGAKTIDNMMEQARRLGIGDRVKFLGSVPLQKIPDIVANADIGIVPKRADSFGNEAYSTKITEFLSQGVPAVVSRTKIDQYYFDDSTVQFFASGNAQEMADAMVEVLTNPERRASLVAAGLEYADRHSWETRKPAYFHLLDSLAVERFERPRLTEPAKS
ncbi:hypothetical protein F183_A54550 (plasmid) [Bryobacterales bacterium F-183]|nr:hypothetical protein F183_A54550 [Bryobacterales bacterium F-183]